jgi:hypothetical protein
MKGRSMSAKPVFALVLLLALGACGGGDPTPAPDEAASGAEVNAAVNGAEAEMQSATDKVEARQDAEARGARAAEETLARADKANGSAAINAQAEIPPIE